MILKAAHYAAECHKGQTRKYNGDPYIYHPMRVAGRVMLLPLDHLGDYYREAAIAAAWLHDVVEDCDISLRSIEDCFNVNVRNIVADLTNPSKGSKLPREKRKEVDRRHLMEVSFVAKCIKAIDRIDNLRDMRDAPDDFRKLYGRESVLLGDALLLGPHGAHETLVNLVSELWELAIPMKNAA